MLNLVYILLVCIISSKYTKTSSPLRYQFHITEETAPGYIGKIPTTTNTRVIFSNNTLRSLLQIVKSNGSIFTTKKIDRDELQIDVIHFMLILTRTHPVEVHIYLTDINDNSPTFPTTVQTLTISEGTKVGSKFHLTPAHDIDLYMNAYIKYELQNVGNSFSIIDQDGSNDVFLRVDESLDREKKSYYVLNLTASDGGQPPRTGSCLLNITISDVNDNRPIFSNNVLVLSLPENTTVGTTIHTFKASDPDELSNSDIQYSIRESTVTDYFTIDKHGSLILSHSLDYEAKTMLSFVVIATDKGLFPLDAELEVTIKILDVNDNSPVIRVRSGNEISIAEERFLSTVITIHDTDSQNVNGNLSIHLSNYEDVFFIALIDNSNLKASERFSVTKGIHRERIYILKSRNVLDREIQDSYHIRLTGNDGLLNTSTDIMVRVTDINDNAPVFRNTRPAVTKPISSPIGTFISLINATDLDEKDNGLVQYMLSKTPCSSLFNLSRFTGVLLTKSFLHGCDVDQVKLIIVATDFGTPPQRSFLNLTINLPGREKGCIPVFKNYQEQMVVDSNVAIHTHLGSYKAVCEHSSAATYFYYIESDRKNYIQVDTYSGEMYLRRRVDFTSTFFVKVVSVNEDNLSLTSVLFVNFTFISIEEDPNIFFSDVLILQVSSKFESKPIATVVDMTTKQTLGEEIKFLITKMTCKDAFFLNESTSELFMSRPFHEMNCTIVTISAIQRTKSNSSIDIFITTNTRPNIDFAFERIHYSFTILENYPKDSIFGSVKLIHNQGFMMKMSKRCKLYIKTGNELGLFSVRQTGVLALEKPTRQSHIRAHTLEIVAICDCMYTSTKVDINIVDINNHIPVLISNSLMDLSVATKIMTMIYHARSEDMDDGINRQITYALAEDCDRHFSINSQTGQITLLRSLSKTYYKINIIMTDGGSPRLDFVTNVLLRVNSSQNALPIFKVPEPILFVRFNVTLHEPIYTVQILNQRDCQKIQFQMTSSLFGIYSSGEIFLKHRNIGNTSNFQEVDVTISCSVNQSAATSQIIYVAMETGGLSILFVKKSFYATVAENSPINETVLNLTANVKFENISMTLSTKSKYFALQNNEIKIDANIDREEIRKRHGTDEVILHVYGHHINHGTESCFVIIHIEDENDNPPVFEWKEKIYNFNVGSKSVKHYVTMNDNDLYPYNVGNFVILSGNRDDVFQLNQTTGQLTTKSLAYPKSRYLLKICVYDPVKPEFNDTLSAVVYLSPSSPTFIQPVLTIELNETVSWGVIMDCKVYVRFANYSLLRFSIAYGNHNGLFAIHQNTGMIYLTSSFDVSIQNRYDLDVSVANELASNISDHMKLIIKIVNVNNHPPTFTNSTLIIYVNENFGVGKTIGHCLATDLDDDDVKYSLTIWREFRKFLSVDRQSCSILVTSRLEKVEHNKVPFVIQSSDGKHLSSLNGVLFILSVSPPLVTSPTAVVVRSGIQPNSAQEIYKVTVKKRLNETVKFRISGGIDSPLFRIREMGELYLIKPWRNGTWFTFLNIIVHSSNGKYGHISLLLFKENNGDRIEFRTTYTMSVRENTNEGEYILDVKAHYKSQTNSPNIKYYITSGHHQHYFKLDRASGKLYVSKIIDREMVGGKITLGIHAIDFRSRSDSQTASTTVEIYIVDENDNYPHFTHERIVLTIPEDSNFPKVITTVAALDADDRQNGIVSYDIQSGNANVTFAIDNETGSVSLRKSLDYVSKSRYTLNISACDCGNPSKCSYMTIMFLVRDVNDNRPSYQHSTYFFSVSENRSVNTHIAEVTATDKDVGINGQIYYEIVSGDYSYFRIDATTGRITLQKILKFTFGRLFVITVRAYDGATPRLSSLTDVYINILKKPGERMPTLHQTYYVLSIAENTSINSSVTRLLDMPGSSYKIVSGDDKNIFSLTANGELILQRKVDREEREQHRLVIALVRREDVLEEYKSYVGINITVTDINDNYPYFRSSPSFHVMENLPKHSVIGQLKAYDDDKGRNGELAYELHDVSTLLFDVEFDGTVKLRNHLDYEIQKLHQFQVRACDQGEKKLCTIQSVHVIVDDQNDNAPKFYHFSNNFTIFNNITVGDIILTMNASDADSGSNSKLKFQLVTHCDIFEVSEGSGQLILNNASALIVNKTYILKVGAHDHGIPQQRSYTEISLRIIEVNTPPQFRSHIQAIDLRENTFPRQPIAVAEAIDNNTGANGKLTYALSGNMPIAYFAINSSTGVLDLLISVDREIIDFFNLTVSVWDDGVPSLNDVAFIYVNIIDENDNRPTLTSPLSITVTEDFPVGGVLQQIAAIDDDAGENGRIRYTLLSHTLFLLLDPISGELEAVIPFDAEYKSTYYVSILIEDFGTPTLAVTENITLTILDVNDSPPRFTQRKYRAKVEAGLSIGSFVMHLRATDEDSFENSNMRFSIEGTSQVIVNEVTGVVLTNVVFQNATQLRFHAVVFDPSKPQFRDAVNVSVTIAVSGLFPQINHPKQLFFCIYENDETYMDFPITKINSSSPLDGLPSVLSYTLDDVMNKEFLIKKDSGHVYLRKTLDFEHAHRHVVWIKIEDSQFPPLQSYILLLIYVVNTNDNPPQFYQNQSTFRILENKPINSTIGALKYYDRDGENSDVVFHLNGTVKVSIDSKTGVLYTNVILDYESCKEVHFNVSVFDPVKTAYHDLILITLYVENTNDNSPMVKQFYDVNLPENQSIRTDLFEIQAIDDDGPHNITYQSNSTIFAIEETNGVVWLNKTLDRESVDFFVLNVTVTDGKFSNSTIIHIHVLDVNDSPPLFKNNKMHVKVLENETVNSIIQKIPICDQDVGENSEYIVLFSTNESVALDYINITTSGNIVLLKNIQITGQPIAYNFVVTAENIVEPYLKTSATIIIEFVDINDHVPAFNQSEYTFYILESTKVGELVTSVFAVDKYDIGKNAMVMYNMTGNTSHLFSIDSISGKINVSMSVQGFVKRWLSLVIIAYDQGNPSLMTSRVLNIFVEEENMSPPQIFDTPYDLVIPEGIPLNHTVLQINAYDIESKADLTYEILSGNKGESFFLSSNGSLVTRKTIDYEKTPSFILKIAISDRNYVNSKSSFIDVNVAVTDLNDNFPVYNETSYYVEVAENFNTTTNVILKVSAWDADSTLYNKLSYAIAEDNSNFSINRETGELSSNHFFDYERQSKYTFHVIVMDNGIPSLSAKVNVTISILGVNEYPPAFSSHSYNFSVFTNAQFGAVVGNVKATDKDLGSDGTCVYISTIPTDYGISLNSRTGEIMVTGVLMEMTLDFKVIVTNVDGALHNLRDTDQARVYVNINVGPERFEFKKKVYQASLLENIHIGKKVVNVSTTVSNKSSTVRFSLQNSMQEVFAIDSTSGVVSVASSLDRELIDRYNLTLIATCNDGKSASAILLVKVLDVNDCPPIIKQCQGNVMENTEIGTTLLELQVIDDDLPPNTQPFTYMTKHPAFSVSQLTGVLVNKVLFDYEKKPKYILNITVTDNGTPKLSSTKECVIHIRDVNDNEGEPRYSKIIVNYDKTVPTKLFVGDVSPIDNDVADNYTCTVMRNDNFYFQQGSCRLFANKNVLTQQNVPVIYNGSLEGKVIGCRVNVSHFNVERYQNSPKVIITIEGVSAHDFIRESYIAFSHYIDLISWNQSRCHQNEARIISIQSQEKKLSFILLLPRASKSYKMNFIEALNLNMNTLIKILKGSKVVTDSNPCNGYCNPLAKCSYQVHLEGMEILNTEAVIFHSIKHTVSRSCSCSIGWVGTQCNDVPSNCKQKPCYNKGRCIETPKGFDCLCNKGFQGKYCHTVTHPCDSQPCSNNGKCTSNGPKYQCNCKFGDFGKQCQIRSLNFKPSSFMKLGMELSLSRFNIRFEFASVEKTGLLMFIYSNDTFVTVEAVNSRLKGSINIPGKNIVVDSDVTVSDGKFHNVQLTVNENTLTMIVDGSRVSVNYVTSCLRPSFYAINIGGVESYQVLKKYASYLSTVEFIGCMNNILIDSVFINPANAILSEGVSIGCERLKMSETCSCGNGGKCLDLWSSFQCLCPGGYISKKCTKEYQAVTLSGSNHVVLSFTKSYKRKKLLEKMVRYRRRILREESYLSIQFRTRNDTGVLFHSSDGSGSTQLFLQDGSIHYRFITKGKTSLSNIPNIIITDGSWHNISMTVRENSVSLVFDGSRSTKHFFRRSVHQFVNPNITKFYFGKNFKGCLGQIKFNEDLLYLSSPTTLFTTNPLGMDQVKVGCISSDVCGEEPCKMLNTSHCIDEWEKFKCVAPGPCVANQCQNNGRCVPQDSGSFSCDCHRTPFTGRLCELHELCVNVRCDVSEQCQVYGNGTVCMATSSVFALDEKYIIAIILTAIFMLAIFVACCAAKRKWNGKKIEKIKQNYFGGGIYNAGQELDDGASYPSDLGLDRTVNLNRSNLSLPAVLINKGNYNSMDIPLHRFQSIDEIADFQRGLSVENLIRHSCESMASSHNGEHISLEQISFPIESGFESTGSVVYVDSKSSVEAYNLDDVSVGYSEMSFQYEQSTNQSSIPFPNLSNPNHQGAYCYENFIPTIEAHNLDDESIRFSEMSFPSRQNPEIDQRSNYTESNLSDSSTGTFSSSDSDVSFTCSECEYGAMSQNKGRRNPRYVFSKLDPVSSRRDQISASDSSEYSMTSFSNSDSISTSNYSKRTRRKRRIRESRGQRKRNATHNKTTALRSQNLEKVPEVIAEEYV